MGFLSVDPTAVIAAKFCKLSCTYVLCANFLLLNQVHMCLAFCFWLRGSPCTGPFMHLLYCFDVTLCIKGSGDLHNVYLCEMQLYFGQVL